MKCSNVFSPIGNISGVRLQTESGIARTLLQLSPAFSFSGNTSVFNDLLRSKENTSLTEPHRGHPEKAYFEVSSLLVPKNCLCC